MNWLIFWCLSVVILFLLPAILGYGYTGNPLDDIKNVEFVGIVIVFFIGGILTGVCALIEILLRKILLLVDIRYSSRTYYIISVVILISLCVFTIIKMQTILTET